jgi:uncharacterized protein (TIGR03437 family)
MSNQHRAAYVFAFVGGLLISTTLCRAQVITTVAGVTNQGYAGDGGPATSASLSHPQGLVLDGAGNLYFADKGNYAVREVNAAGTINTVAGPGSLIFGAPIGDGGPATSANFAWTNSLFVGAAIDAAGNLYFSDSGHGRVRKINPAGIISTVAGNGVPGSGGDGGPATSASLFAPAGIALDSVGNLYIADPPVGRVRKVDTSGNISTVAGTGTVGYSGDGGPATSAQILPPIGLAVDAKGNLYIAETGAGVPHVRKVDATGIITTFAGSGNSTGFAGDGGPAINAQLNTLAGLAVDQAGNLYIADAGNYRVRKVDTSGIITTVAGTGQINLGGTGDGGAAISAALQPSGLAFDAAGNLYVADYSAGRIRKIAFGIAPPGLSVSSTSLYFAGKSVNPSIAQQILTISSAGAPIKFTVAATTTSGGTWLGVGTSSTTTSASIGVSVNNSPTPLPAGTYKGALTITPTSPGYSPVTVAVTLVLSATVPTAPVIATGGVTNAASNQLEAGIASNSYVTIKGTNLASTTDTWNNSIVGGQLPTVLDGVTVMFSGTPAYISYISPTQINVLVPSIALGTASVQVINNGAVGGGPTVGASQYDPAFFLFSGSTQVIATRQDYTYAAKAGTITGLATIPAKPGDVLILWGTGFGATTPPALPGVVTPSDKTYSTSTPVTVTINNVAATVYGAALAPGYAGLYQVAIQVPTSLGNGDWPVVATVGSAILLSNTSSPSGVILTVHN